MNLILCRDPRDRDVVLSEETWFGHVLVRHPELAGLAASVSSTLAAPTLITADALFPSRENYHRLAALPLPRSHLYLPLPQGVRRVRWWVGGTPKNGRYRLPDQPTQAQGASAVALTETSAAVRSPSPTWPPITDALLEQTTLIYDVTIDTMMVNDGQPVRSGTTGVQRAARRWRH